MRACVRACVCVRVCACVLHMHKHQSKSCRHHYLTPTGLKPRNPATLTDHHLTVAEPDSIVSLINLSMKSELSVDESSNGYEIKCHFCCLIVEEPKLIFVIFQLCSCHTWCRCQVNQNGRNCGF